jgi:hypothetical protein
MANAGFAVVPAAVRIDALEKRHSRPLGDEPAAV